MFSKVLIANRGEVAVRIARTARRLGMAVAQVYSEADADSLAVEMADEAVLIGPAPAAQSYLRIEAVVAAAKRVGADAVHPGFGFLSENPAFARALAAEGIAFVGPNPYAIEAMGDKIASKRLAAAAGVATVPGFVGVIEDAEHAVGVAEQIGFPVMIKASAGGGGKGMRVAYDAAGVREGFSAARAEAKQSFGDDRVFIEAFVTEPRHIEIQLLGDKHGTLVHLHERECSIQRRNQKVIEEAPSPFVTPALRARMGEQAIALGRAVDYDSAGTVEFIVDANANFYFLEMNTRLQVEHPVTELITGVDIVEQMFRAAAGERLPFAQGDVRLDGWAIEARVYAEDPYRGFAPSTGRLVRYQAPPDEAQGGSRVRNDTGVREGDEISMFYDPMIAKLSTWAPTRDRAIDRMAGALDGFRIEGVSHNLPFLSAVMDDPRFGEGRLSTAYIAETFPGGFHGLAPTPFQRDLATATAAFAQATLEARAGRDAGRGRAWVVRLDEDARPIRLDREGETLRIELTEEGRTLRLEAVDWRPGKPLFHGTLDGRRFTCRVARTSRGLDLRHRAVRLTAQVLRPDIAALYARLPRRAAADTSKRVLSPMPGLVVSVEVGAGEAVQAGQPLAVIEAMKMQNVIRAERDGVVKRIAVQADESVAADDLLFELA